jgi:hypothetical protein
MSHARHLPLYQAALDLAVHLEGAVRRFARYHKYTLGTELRQCAQHLCRLATRAAQCGAQQRPAVLGELVLAVEDMKTLLAQAQQTRAFTHFNDFAQATEITVSPGSQWRWLARTLPGHLPLVQVGRCWLVRGACTWVSTPSPLVGEGRGGGAAARAVCAAPVSTPPPPHPHEGRGELAGKAVQQPGLSGCTARPLAALPQLRRALRAQGMAHAVMAQAGHYRTGFKRRVLCACWAPPAPPMQSKTPSSAFQSSANSYQNMSPGPATPQAA